MRMVPAMDHMDMDTDKPMVLQTLNSLSTPIQSEKQNNKNKVENNKN